MAQVVDVATALNFTPFDYRRRVRPLITDEKRTVSIDVDQLGDEVQCPVCLQVLRETKIAMTCMHRFCSECIEKALRTNNNECPSCRGHIPSRRSLRPDLAFDSLIATLFPDLAEREAKEEQEMARVSQYAERLGEVLDQERELTAEEEAEDWARREALALRRAGSETPSATPKSPPAKSQPASSPVAKPPVAKPPVAKPPVAKPPVAKPPVAKPPVAKPPVAKPPVARPPVAKPPVAKPPVAKSTSAATSASATADTAAAGTWATAPAATTPAAATPTAMATKAKGSERRVAVGRPSTAAAAGGGAAAAAGAAPALAAETPLSTLEANSIRHSYAADPTQLMSGRIPGLEVEVLLPPPVVRQLIGSEAHHVMLEQALPESIITHVRVDPMFPEGGLPRVGKESCSRTNVLSVVGDLRVFLAGQLNANHKTQATFGGEIAPGDIVLRQFGTYAKDFNPVPDDVTFRALGMRSYMRLRTSTGPQADLHGVHLFYHHRRAVPGLAREYLRVLTEKEESDPHHRDVIVHNTLMPCPVILRWAVEEGKFLPQPWWHRETMRWAPPGEMEQLIAQRQAALGLQTV